jgi:hypothetical protein
MDRRNDLGRTEIPAHGINCNQPGFTGRHDHPMMAG